MLFRCSLSPKWPFWTAAILDCIIGILYMEIIWKSCHDFGNRTKLDFTIEVPSGTFVFKQNMHRCHQVFPITPSFRAEWTAGKHLGHAKPRGIAWYHPSNLKSSLNFWTQSGCHWHKKEEKHPITCEPHSTIKALNDDTYDRVQFIQYTAWRAWMLHGLSRKEWTLTYIKRKKNLKAWPLRHRRQNHALLWFHIFFLFHATNMKSQYVITATWKYTLKINQQELILTHHAVHVLTFKPCLGCKKPEHCASTHPLAPNTSSTIPRPSIQLQLDSFRRKNCRNTENSTTLADLKNATWKIWKQSKTMGTMEIRSQPRDDMRW